MNQLRDGKDTEALKLLERSKRLAENNEHGLAMTCNNLACYYRKQGHLRAALFQLEKAMEIEQKFPQTASKADTHLNLCAVLSQLNRHELALQHA